MAKKRSGKASVKNSCPGPVVETKYRLESIHRHEFDEHGQLYFLVHWQNWPCSGDTWIFREDFHDGGEDILKAYMEEFDEEEFVFHPSKVIKKQSSSRKKKGSKCSRNTKKSPKSKKTLVEEEEEQEEIVNGEVEAHDDHDDIPAPERPLPVHNHDAEDAENGDEVEEAMDDGEDAGVMVADDDALEASSNNDDVMNAVDDNSDAPEMQSDDDGDEDEPETLEDGVENVDEQLMHRENVEDEKNEDEEDSDEEEEEEVEPHIEDDVPPPGGYHRYIQVQPGETEILGHFNAFYDTALIRCKSGGVIIRNIPRKREPEPDGHDE